MCERLYPICRSITGTGVRETLKVLSEYIPILIEEVPSGTQVFDWTVPKEWNISGAHIISPDGQKILDFADHNLHVMSYSAPVDASMSLATLDEHLFSLPDQPDLIPYRTSYYSEQWGFCVPHRLRQTLVEGEYKVRIDSSFTQGSLTYGEIFIPGKSDQELLLSTHICHPSLANDNLSGLACATLLAKEAQTMDLHYGLRIIFVPSTIGAITWLSQNENKLANIVSGLVMSGLGDDGAFTYKLSKRADGIVDRLVSGYIREGLPGRITPFIPYGYDERQYCSPGINLAMGCLMRTPFGEYPEYHTSADNLDFVSDKQLGDSYALVKRIIQDAQMCRTFKNENPFGEPQLGKRGLYDAIGGDNDQKTAQLALLWMLSSSDGATSTLDICKSSGIDLKTLNTAAERLEASGLISPVSAEEIS